MDPTTLDALKQLDTAISKRIQKENEFIDRMVAEFQKISAGIQRTVQTNPQMSTNMQPYITRINEAAQKLNDTKSFGINPSDFEEAVQKVIGVESPQSSMESPQRSPPYLPQEGVERRGGWKSRKSRRKRRTPLH